MMFLDSYKFLHQNFETRNILHAIFWDNPQLKSLKNNFFRFLLQNCLKFDLNEFRYRFRVQNTSKTSHGLISGHITQSSKRGGGGSGKCLLKIPDFFDFFIDSRTPLWFPGSKKWSKCSSRLVLLEKHF